MRVTDDNSANYPVGPAGVLYFDETFEMEVKSLQVDRFFRKPFEDITVVTFESAVLNLESQIEGNLFKFMNFTVKVDSEFE